MGITRKAYPAKFREQMVRLVRAGRTNWVMQMDLDEGKRSDGLKSDEREELARLRRENARLKEEREILSKAAAGFAQETQSKSSRS
jgi:transposase